MNADNGKALFGIRRIEGHFFGIDLSEDGADSTMGTVCDPIGLQLWWWSMRSSAGRTLE